MAEGSPLQSCSRETLNHAPVSHSSFGVKLHLQIGKGIKGLQFLTERKYKQFYIAATGSRGNKQKVNW
jgi:hypothetical protein